MAKIEVNANDIKEQINDLKLYRSGWANDIREGWTGGMPGAKELIFDLYQISGCIILALQDILKGRYRDKLAMILVKRKLSNLTHSQTYHRFDEMGKAGICHVISNGTKHHIRVMMECLEILTD
mgnify:CR=1 FL=1